MSSPFRDVDTAAMTKLVGTTMPMRRFLDMFGVRVRNHDNVSRISAVLAAAEVATVPSFATCPGTAELHVVKATCAPAQSGEDEEDELPPAVLPSRALRVDDLPSARAGLVSVTSDTTLTHATWLMRTSNYSQLPVIDGTSNLRGVLTWGSIALSIETGKQPTLRTAMATDSLPVAEVHQQLLAHLPAIMRNGYLLVRANDGTFVGIVTAADISDRFEIMARPFFLVGDIEERLRRCLGVLDAKAVTAVQRYKKTGRVVDLMFGDYQRLFAEDGNWARIGWTGVPREQFLHRLDRVRAIRNQIAHFHPEPLPEASLAVLQEFAGLLRQYVP